MKRVALLVMLTACGPEVAAGSGTDGASGGRGDRVSSSGQGGESSSGGAVGIDCVPALEHGSVSREQVASSLAATLCIAQEACCEAAPPSPSCRHGLNMTFEQIDENAAELGLTYDGSCAGYQQAMVTALGCDASPPPEFTGFGTCSIYFGKAELGAPCTSLGRLGSTCAQGLACAGSTCVDPCLTDAGARRSVYGFACLPGEVVVAEACGVPAGPGESCAGACAEGLICGDDQRCVAGGLPGEDCSGDADCSTSVCADGVCVVPSTEGQPCGARCGAGLICVDAFCEPAPRVCVGLES